MKGRKKMKKRFLMLFSMLFLLAFVVGCGNGNGNGGEKKGTFWDEDGNGIEDWLEKPINLTYASWQHTELEQITVESLMIDAFMEKYPNITVEMISIGHDWEWQDNMIARAEAHTAENPQFPDVFLVRRLESDLPYGWLADISEMYKNDPDTQYIFPALQASGTFGNKRYAVPTYIYPQFWIVNKTLLEEANVPIPSYNWSWEAMEQTAKMTHNETKKIIGLYGVNGGYGVESGTRGYISELPKVIKLKSDSSVAATWSSRGFDGESFNYLDDAQLTAFNKLTTALNEGWCKIGLTAEEKLEYYGAEDYRPTVNGKVSIWREESWSFKDVKDILEFEWDIYPGPGGVTGGNTDIIGISSLCAEKKAAYQLLKWMSYGEEGILKRFEIFSEYSDVVYRQGNNYPYPIVDYGIDSTGKNRIWESIPYSNTAPGLVTPEYLEGLRNGAFQMNKEYIGWDAADFAVGDYLEQIFSGQTTFAAVREAMENDSKKALEQARAALGFLNN
jgi:multiple sugar transport system substrate-binding protein